jgi:hypothetical protein
MPYIRNTNPIKELGLFNKKRKESKGMKPGQNRKRLTSKQKAVRGVVLPGIASFLATFGSQKDVRQNVGKTAKNIFKKIF